MDKNLKEYIIRPNWIESLSDKEAYNWYLIAKRDLAIFKERGGGEKLERAIIDYEQRHRIK